MSADKPGMWWVTRDTDGRIAGVHKARHYLKERALFGQIEISFADMEQAIWLAIKEADSATAADEEATS